MSRDSTKIILGLVKEIGVDVKECHVRLTEIEKLDATQNALLDEHMRRTKAVEKRTTMLENFKWYFAGIAVIITAVLKALGDKL